MTGKVIVELPYLEEAVKDAEMREMLLAATGYAAGANGKLDVMEYTLQEYLSEIQYGDIEPDKDCNCNNKNCPKCSAVLDWQCKADAACLTVMQNADLIQRSIPEKHYVIDVEVLDTCTVIMELDSYY